MWGDSHQHQPHSAHHADVPHPDTIAALKAEKLLEQLSLARAAFRAEQETVRAKRTEEETRLSSRQNQARQLSQAARRDRQRVKALYARFLKRMKQRWSTERKEAEAEREKLTSLRAHYESDAEQLALQRSTFTAEAKEYQERLQSSWQSLQEGQERLIAERDHFELWVKEQAESIEQRSAQLSEREHASEIAHIELRERSERFQQEIASLEARAGNLRTLLKGLEKQRADAEAFARELQQPTGQQLVPLTPVYEATGISVETERLLANLRQGELELIRERSKLKAEQEEITRREAALADERSILMEQVAALAQARSTWNTAELHNVDELETLARALRAREEAADERDRQALEADRRRKQQEQELIAMRERIEIWQNALQEHESAARTARERADTDWETRRDRLRTWEANIENITSSWNRQREQERIQLSQELEHWATARRRYEASLVHLDSTREQFLAETRNAAALAMSIEEAHPTAGPYADRRMRVLRKKWEKHFDRFRNELEKRRAECAADAEEANERIAELQRILIQCDDALTVQHLKQLQRDREYVTSLIHQDPDSTQ